MIDKTLKPARAGKGGLDIYERTWHDTQNCRAAQGYRVHVFENGSHALLVIGITGSNVAAVNIGRTLPN